MRSRATLLFAAVLVLGPTSPLRAQAGCFVDDGFLLPGTCCAPVAPGTIMLPAFPAMTITCNEACLRDCGPESVAVGSMFLGAAIPLFCDFYAIPLDINGPIDTAFAFLLAKYARTWLEIDNTGVVSRQVWRFLINTDLQYITAGPIPNPIPPCSNGGTLVHFVGSIDYARDCANPNVWSAAINLTHHCGDLAHGPFSQRPTTIFNHPDRMYSFVGPAPFNFANPQPAPQGMFTVGDAMRSTAVNLTFFNWSCFHELPIVGGQSILNTQNCLCGTSSAAQPRWEHFNFRLDYGCFVASDFLQAVPWLPNFPTGMAAFQLGTYALPAGSFASNRSVSVYVGIAIGTDPCAGNFPLHLLHGVGTRGGDHAFMPLSPVLTDQMLDLSNQMVITGAPPFMAVGYGAPFISTMIWSAAFI